MSSPWRSSPSRSTTKCSTKQGNTGKKKKITSHKRDTWTVSEKACMKGKLERKKPSSHCSEALVFTCDGFWAIIQKTTYFLLATSRANFIVVLRCSTEHEWANVRETVVLENQEENLSMQSSKSSWWILALLWMLTRPDLTAALWCTSQQGMRKQAPDTRRENNTLYCVTKKELLHLEVEPASQLWGVQYLTTASCTLKRFLREYLHMWW